MATLIAQIHAVHRSLTAADLRHAFGGAIALAYYTEEPRGTRDLDINVFVPADRARDVVAALPEPVRSDDSAIEQIIKSGQTRLWWDETPLDLFLNNLPLHDEVSKEIRWVEFAGREIPILSGPSLVVFKAFFDRTKDWADIESMAAVDPSVVAGAADRVAALIGADSSTVSRLRSLSR